MRLFSIKTLVNDTPKVVIGVRTTVMRLFSIKVEVNDTHEDVIGAGITVSINNQVMTCP
jgi:hypothetical protein